MNFCFEGLPMSAQGDEVQSCARGVVFAVVALAAAAAAPGP
jgi:hypothetical protein